MNKEIKNVKWYTWIGRIEEIFNSTKLKEMSPKCFNSLEEMFKFIEEFEKDFGLENSHCILLLRKSQEKSEKENDASSKITLKALKDERRILFEQKAMELLEYLIEKDAKYAGEKPLGNIKDNAKTFGITPLKFCLLRINEKWNRVRHNSNNIDIINEELKDIWGYCLLGLLLIDEEKLQNMGN